MSLIVAVMCVLAWETGLGLGAGGAIHLLLVGGVVLLLFWILNAPPKNKVKIQSEADSDSLEKAQQQIRDLQEALRFCVDCGDTTREQLELAVARAEMFKRHKEEIVGRVEGILHMARWIQDDRDAAEAEVIRLNEMVERLRAVWAKTGKTAALRLQEIEHFTVQMAGISTAVLGGTKYPAVQGQYGWSAPYQDVLDLRAKYDRLRTLINTATSPHCDQDVLHAPSLCEVCDKFAKLQADRLERKINFTGGTREGFAPCPSDERRGRGVAEKWHGNRATSGK